MIFANRMEIMEAQKCVIKQELFINIVVKMMDMKPHVLERLLKLKLNCKLIRALHNRSQD